MVKVKYLHPAIMTVTPTRVLMHLGLPLSDLVSVCSLLKCHRSLIFCKYEPIRVNVRTFAVQMLFMPLRFIKQSIQMLAVLICGTEYECVCVCV